MLLWVFKINCMANTLQNYNMLKGKVMYHKNNYVKSILIEILIQIINSKKTIG